MHYDERALQTVRQTRLEISDYDAWLAEAIRPFIGQRVIEVGCGLGNLLRYFADRELVIGIENSAGTVGQAKQAFSAVENISIREYSIIDPAVLTLRDMQFDSAVSLNVFEHLEDDELAMRHTAQLLKPGGNFILIVPAHRWLYGTMDRSIGHFRRYTKTLSQEKLERNGFQVVHQRYFNMLGAMGWLVNGRLLKRTVPPTGQLRLFNRIVPFLKTIERGYSPPFGISIITLARRRADRRTITA